MKTTPAVLALLFALTLALPAHAQQRLTGTWQVESVGQVEPPEGVSLTLAFKTDGVATLTYTLPGDGPQSWDYNFTVDAGQLTLTPAKAFGDPETVTYDIRFDAGKLLLLPPKPEDDEPAEDETADDGEDDADASEGEGDTTGDADEPTDETGDGAADTEDEAADDDTPGGEDEDEQEDTRKAVWVLVPVG
ncbi:MAG: lipocalin family protein [Phycisphaeraceae bacterium]